VGGVSDLVPILLFAGYFAAIVGSLLWLAARVRSRAIGGAVMAPVEEIFRPTAHQSRVEIEVQDERMVPMPSPEDT
jgi:hypothetical protein